MFGNPTDDLFTELKVSQHDHIKRQPFKIKYENILFIFNAVFKLKIQFEHITDLKNTPTFLFNEEVILNPKTSVYTPD